jgi:tetratricopeptide (TPR) repeat protein
LNRSTASLDSRPVKAAFEDLLLGATMDVFEAFVTLVGGREKLVGLTTSAVCECFVLRLTSVDDNQVSFCQKLLKETPSGIRKATVLIAHCWRNLFLDTYDSLVYKFRDSKEVLWFDLFSCNQHHDREEFILKDQMRIVKEISSVYLFIPSWRSTGYLHNTQCLFEIYFAGVLHILLPPKELIDLAYQIAENNEVIDLLLADTDILKSQTVYKEEMEFLLTVIESNISFDVSEINTLIMDKLKSSLALSFASSAEKHLHSEELTVYFNIAYAELLHTANIQLAVALMTDCLAFSKSFFGEDNSITLTAMSVLAELYVRTDEIGLAEELHLQCLNCRQGTEKALVSMHHLANIYAKKGQYEEAVRVYEDCLERNTSVVDTARLRTMKVYQSLV